MKPPSEPAAADLSAKHKERKDRFATLGGIPLKSVYTEADLADDKFDESIGAPGEFPCHLRTQRLILLRSPSDQIQLVALPLQNFVKHLTWKDYRPFNFKGSSS